MECNIEQNSKIITLTKDIQNLISISQKTAIKAVDTQRVILYWSIGKRIYEELQSGKDRADYGKQIIKTLSLDLEPIYGSGYSYRQLYLFMQFFKVFPIVNALHSQLNWTQYKLLVRVEDKDKREFYISESCKNLWSSRELERQINSSLYERLLLSNDKKSVLQVAKDEKLLVSANESIKDPMVLEFLGLEQKSHYYEKDLEQAIISNLQDFENATIGVLLCADKNDTVVKYTLPQENKTILASKYQLYLPSEKELIKELNKELKVISNE